MLFRVSTRYSIPVLLTFLATSLVRVSAQEPNKQQFRATQASQNNPPNQTAAPAPQSPEQQIAPATDVNQQLLEAAQKGDKAAVESLLAQGADRNAKDKDGRVPLMLAAAGGHADVVDVLLVAKVDVNLKANDGGTALTTAALEGHAEVVERLLAAKADVNAQDNDGVTALMSAVRQNEIGKLIAKVRRNDTNSARAVQALLGAGADVNARDHNGVTALMFAAEAGFREALEMLLAAGADPNVKIAEFEKVKAYSPQSIQRVNFIVTLPDGHEVSVHLVKVKGWTALKAAKDGHYQDIEELLKKAGAKD